MEKLDTSPSHLKNNNHILYTEILTLKIELGIFHKTTFVQSTMDHFEIFRHFGVQTSTISPSVGMMVQIMTLARKMDQV